MKAWLFAALSLAAAVCHAYDVNGVPLGANESAIRKAFPSAYCKPLEWHSEAADRRCDDARIAFAGVRARVTFYLRREAVQAFTVRFDAREREKVAAFFRSRWGAPAGEITESISRKDKETKRVYKARWDQGSDHALLTAQLDSKRGSLEVWRGNFQDEIYRVR